MVIDRSKGGLSGQAAIWAVAATLLLAAFGFAYSLGQSVAEVNRKLDRNCVYIKDIALGLRVHELQSRRAHELDGHNVANPFFPDVTC